MRIVPAVDIRGGLCVNLVQGDYAQETVFSEDPVAQALAWWQALGDGLIHIVDLDGALEGRCCVTPQLRAIATAGVPFEVGGGIRDMATIRTILDTGAQRVILGTAAHRDPGLLRDACANFPGRIAVGIDAREGYVAVAGWAETSTEKALDLALKFEDSGVAAIIYTDINRDGAMGGVNVEATADLAFHLTTPVIASGGVSSIDDLAALKKEERSGIEGVICGRALYDGRIDPEAALALLSAPMQEAE